MNFYVSRAIKVSIISSLVIACMAFVFILGGCSDQVNPSSSTGLLSQKINLNKTTRINIALNTDATDAIIAELGGYGNIHDVIYEIDAVMMKTKVSNISDIQDLPYVKSVGYDAGREGVPIDYVAVTDFTGGINTWDNDAIGVTDFGAGRVVTQTGAGVIVAILDTGLLDDWRKYLANERILEQYCTSFTGGGAGFGNAGENPNKWEADRSSHGTHVTSTVSGYQIGSRLITGVAPMADIIEVKVLNQTGSGWSSAIARGLVYIANLKLYDSYVSGYPVVINMSLGGSVLDPIEQAALDYAIGAGVIVCASAGNSGPNGYMGYPGAYGPVISSASCGWGGEWAAPSWYRTLDVADPHDPDHFYISDFSSRQGPGQDLDVTAPGSWVVGPYQPPGEAGGLGWFGGDRGVNSYSFFYLGGTSMASPHTAGVVALMCEKYPALTPAQAEAILEGTTVHINGSYFGEGSPPYTPADMGAGMINAPAAIAATP
jgi:subtilisin family serine protease